MTITSSPEDDARTHAPGCSTSDTRPAHVHERAKRSLSTPAEITDIHASMAVDIVSSVADDLPVGVWVARAPNGEFLYANKAFAEIMGMGARDDVARGDYAGPYGIHTRTGELYPEDKLPFVRALQEKRTVIVDDI